MSDLMPVPPDLVPKLVVHPQDLLDQESELGVLALAQLCSERLAKESVSSDDRTNLRRYAARLADGLACELHGALHQRPLTSRVDLGDHIVKVRRRSPCPW